MDRFSVCPMVFNSIEYVAGIFPEKVENDKNVVATVDAFIVDWTVINREVSVEASMVEVVIELPVKVE